MAISITILCLFVAILLWNNRVHRIQIGILHQRVWRLERLTAEQKGKEFLHAPDNCGCGT